MDTVLGHTKAEIATSSGPGIQISRVLTSLTTIDSSGCNVITNTLYHTLYCSQSRRRLRGIGYRYRPSGVSLLRHL